MGKAYSSLLISILIASSVCLATESAQSQPQVATITGEIRDPTAREIKFGYESPSALEDSEQRVALDSLNRFSFELPVVRGTLVRAYHNEVRSMFFVEPGDSLHVVVDEQFPHGLVIHGDIAYGWKWSLRAYSVTDYGDLRRRARLYFRDSRTYKRYDPAPYLAPESNNLVLAGDHVCVVMGNNLVVFETLQDD